MNMQELVIPEAMSPQTIQMVEETSAAIFHALRQSALRQQAGAAEYDSWAGAIEYDSWSSHFA